MKNEGISEGDKFVYDVHLYAQWSVKNKYRIVFNDSLANNTYYLFVDDDMTITAPSYSVNRYNFNGWAFYSIDSLFYRGGDTLTFNNVVENAFRTSDTSIEDSVDAFVYDYNLHAQWSPYTYTIKYHANNGTDTVKTEYVNAGSLPKTLTSIKNLGITYARHNFKGWSTSASSSTVTYTDSATLSKDLAIFNTNGSVIDVYAQWTPYTYTIKYHANNGTNTVKTETFNADNLPKILTSIKNLGFTYAKHNFKGWSTSASSSTVTYTDGTTLSKDLAIFNTNGAEVNVYAQWEENRLYRLILNPDNLRGYGSQEIIEFPPNTMIKLSTYNGNYKPKSGYNTLSWSYNPYGSEDTDVTDDDFDITNLKQNNYTIKNESESVKNQNYYVYDLNIYARYTAKEYTVNFNSNIQSGDLFIGETQVSVVPSNKDVTSNNVVTCNGETCTDVTYTDNDKKYSDKTYQLKFTLDDYEQLLDNRFELNGFDFIGWSYSQDKKIDAGDYKSDKNVREYLVYLVNLIENQNNNSATLYAIWRPIYVIKLNNNYDSDSIPNNDDEPNILWVLANKKGVSIDAPTTSNLNGDPNTQQYFKIRFEDIFGTNELPTAFDDINTIDDFEFNSNVFTRTYTATNVTFDMKGWCFENFDGYKVQEPEEGMVYETAGTSNSISIKINEKVDISTSNGYNEINLYAVWKPRYIIKYHASYDAMVGNKDKNHIVNGSTNATPIFNGNETDGVGMIYDKRYTLTNQTYYPDINYQNGFKIPNIYEYYKYTKIEETNPETEKFYGYYAIKYEAVLNDNNTIRKMNNDINEYVLLARYHVPSDEYSKEYKDYLKSINNSSYVIGGWYIPGKTYTYQGESYYIVDNTDYAPGLKGNEVIIGRKPVVDGDTQYGFKIVTSPKKEGDEDYINYIYTQYAIPTPSSLQNY